MKRSLTFDIEGILRSALSGMENAPQPLQPALRFYAKRGGPTVGVIERAILERVSKGPNEPIRSLLNDQLKRWDWLQEMAWTAGTAPNTRARRDLVYELLGLGGRFRRLLDEYVPPYEGVGNIVIADKAAWH